MAEAIMTVDTANSYFRLFDEISFGSQLRASGTLALHGSDKLGEYRPDGRKIYLSRAVEYGDQIFMHELN
jgi:hypothetical protein